MSKKKTDNYIVTQSNDLIEADYSKSKLTVNAMKIAKLVVAKLSPDDSELRLVRISNSAIKQYFGYKTTSKYNRFHKDVDQACKRLNEQTIAIKLPTGNTLNAFFISSFEIDNANDETIFEISGRLKPYLLQLRDNYTSYQLSNIPQLNSTYSIRFYELLSQYRLIGKRKFELEDLKRKVGCSYPSYGHFKKKALLLAQKHLLSETDIMFEFEEIKTVRKVTSLIFYIYPNNPKKQDAQQVLPFLEEEFKDNEVKPFYEQVLKIFQEIGLSDKNLEAMISQGFDIIENEENRKNAEKRCRTIDQYFVEKLTLLQQTKSPKNPAGFFVKAVKEDWTVKVPTSSSKPRKGSSLEKSKKLKQIAQLEKQIEVVSRTIEKQQLDITQNRLKGDIEALKSILATIKTNMPIASEWVARVESDLTSFADDKSVTALIISELANREPQLFERMKELNDKKASLKKKLKDLK